MARRPIKNIDPKIEREVMREARKNGLNGISTKLIAERLKVSEALIFSHYQNKNRLLRETFIHAYNSLPYQDIFPYHDAFPFGTDEDSKRQSFLKLARECRRKPLPFMYVMVYIEDPSFIPAILHNAERTEWTEGLMHYLNKLSIKDRRNSFLFLFDNILRALNLIISNPKSEEAYLSSLYWNMIFTERF